MILLNKTVQLFLDSIGRRDEYEFYLNKFHTHKTPAFALLCPTLETLETSPDLLDFDLSFLKQLELAPALLFAEAPDQMRQAFLAKTESPERYVFLDADEPDLEAKINPLYAQKKVPVICASGKLSDELLNLVPRIAKRVHFIRPSGGLKEHQIEMPYYYITQSSPQKSGWIELATRLLTHCPSAHISLTSTQKLLSEIFTVKGAGTLFRRAVQIDACRPDEIDCERLIRLIEKSFGKSLSTPAALSFDSALLEQNYKACALIEDVNGLAYLSKFAVDPNAQGAGTSGALWDELEVRFPNLFWRSRLENSFNHWYARAADGSHATDKWMIFWRNVPVARIPELIDFCETRLEDFE